MSILESYRKYTFEDFYLLYIEESKKVLSEPTAKATIAKFQTAIYRYVLPGFGLELLPDKNLSPEKKIEGLNLMKSLSLAQANSALEVQERVFQQFGDRISPGIKRVYRSSLKKALDWGHSQDFWIATLGNRAQDRTPAMHPKRGQPKERYSLLASQRNPRLQREIDHLCQCWTEVRSTPLSQASIQRYLKNINNLLGWLHRYKAVPLADLSLTTIVSPDALNDPVAAHRVAQLAQEYLDWLRVERNASPATRRYAFDAFLHITEYIHYVCSISASQ